MAAMQSLTGTLKLNDDVIVAPVTDLSPESRAQIECEPGDFAICRLQGRSGSKIIDADTADLLTRFREPRTVVESVVLFAREKKLDPNQTLEEAFPLLSNLLAEGVLVHAGGTEEPKASQSHWGPGDILLDGKVVRVLQILDDTEIYLLTSPQRRWKVLKVERTSVHEQMALQLKERFRREIAILTHLNGRLAPCLFGHGALDGRAYLEMEFVHGTDAMSAAAELRERRNAEQEHELHTLICSIADAYAELHSVGIVHGDVHPRNIMVTRKGEIRLIDFGLARSFSTDTNLPDAAERGGMPFFFDPQLAQSSLAGSTPQPATPATEQYALAAMLYFVIIGHHWQDLRLSQKGMLEDIIERKPLSFSDRGMLPWPGVEEVLGRALSKAPDERFPSMSSFAEALREVELSNDGASPALTLTSPLKEALHRAIASTSIDGILLREGLRPAPTCSITYGAAGIALGLLHIAQRLKDPGLLAAADVWSRRALLGMGEAAAFYNKDIEITPEVVGEASPYHTASGIHAVASLIACAMGDSMAQSEAVSRYLEAVRKRSAGLDLVLGDCSTILGAAILLDALSATPELDTAALCAFGNEAVTKLWSSLDKKPSIPKSDVEYLGIAHGWAGFAYATLQWCRVAGTAVPEGVHARLQELAELAIPAGRGIQWPWVLRETGEPQTMPGWCNGTCGYVFLWTAAHAIFGDDQYLDLAEEAAWHSWEAPDGIATLCCGLLGRVYALLNLYRHTREREWLNRARELALRTAKEGHFPPEYPNSLYKGEFGLAVLAADLEEPDRAVMPFFETIGYHRPEEGS
jgi:serine/threonine protein kinase